MVETVKAQLSTQFNIEANYAHTLCVYINRLPGKPASLQIKALTFPI